MRVWKCTFWDVYCVAYGEKLTRLEEWTNPLTLLWNGGCDATLKHSSKKHNYPLNVYLKKLWKGRRCARREKVCIAGNVFLTFVVASLLCQEKINLYWLNETLLFTLHALLSTWKCTSTKEKNAARSKWDLVKRTNIRDFGALLFIKKHFLINWACGFKKKENVLAIYYFVATTTNVHARLLSIK